jgi:hypothetical protein
MNGFKKIRLAFPAQNKNPHRAGWGFSISRMKMLSPDFAG